ncbi:MAG: hypothetical protein V2B18_15890 [Pseudomonadota bacterium]
MNRILRMLADTNQSIPKYVLRAGLVSAIPEIIVGIMFIKLGVYGWLGPPPEFSHTARILSSIADPWIEVFIMRPVMRVLQRRIRKTLWIGVASGVILGGLFYSPWGPGWGLGAVWRLLVLSMCLMEWEKKDKKRAIIVTGLANTCGSLLCGIVYIISFLAT